MASFPSPHFGHPCVLALRHLGLTSIPQHSNLPFFLHKCELKTSQLPAHTLHTVALPMPRYSMGAHLHQAGMSDGKSYHNMGTSHMLLDTSPHYTCIRSNCLMTLIVAQSAGAAFYPARPFSHVDFCFTCLCGRWVCWKSDLTYKLEKVVVAKCVCGLIHEGINGLHRFFCLQAELPID